MLRTTRFGRNIRALQPLKSSKFTRVRPESVISRQIIFETIADDQHHPAGGARAVPFVLPNRETRSDAPGLDSTCITNKRPPPTTPNRIGLPNPCYQLLTGLVHDCIPARVFEQKMSWDVKKKPKSKRQKMDAMKS